MPNPWPHAREPRLEKVGHRSLAGRGCLAFVPQLHGGSEGASCLGLCLAEKPPPFTIRAKVGGFPASVLARIDCAFTIRAPVHGPFPAPSSRHLVPHSTHSDLGCGSLTGGGRTW